MSHSAIVARDPTRKAYAVIMAGGRGSRLQELTDKRVKPAVYFGGKFRIIDFALSNCFNSGITRIGILTQYKSHSLLRHLQRGWSFPRADANQFIDLLPAQQRIDEDTWYQGTADAVYQNLDILRGHGPRYIVVLAGDHVYKMDYASLLQDHIDRGAPATVGCIEIPRSEATEFGVMAVDESLRVTAFLEKPADPPGMPGKPDRCLASMGLYVFDADYLYDLLARDFEDETSSHDFGMDLMPLIAGRGELQAHPFDESCVKSQSVAEAYWRDVGTIDSYWQANIDLTDPAPALDMYDTSWPIWTHQLQLAPAKFLYDEETRRGGAIDSLVSGGCIISGTTLRRSVLFSQVRVNSYCRIEGCVLLPSVEVERHARLKNVVVDRGVRIPNGLVVGEDREEDERRFRRSDDGVVLITKTMIQALGATS